MTTSHEPAYPEDGIPKDRYRAYHEERAKAGVALTMTAGSAAVSLDMVGMTRAHIADPPIVKKIAEGREHDIRPCVGATNCLDRIYQAGEALCIQNAATGRELSMPHTIKRAKLHQHVVIVGNGPAGMEAARAAGERGHKVTVFEAAHNPGGQIRLTARNPRRMVSNSRLLETSRERFNCSDWVMPCLPAILKRQFTMGYA